MLLVIYKVITLVNPSLNDFYMIFKLSTLVNQVGEQSTGKAWIIPVIHLQLTESVAGKRGRKGGKKHFINSPFSNSRIVSVHAIRHLRNGRVGPEGCVHSLPQAHWLINPTILWHDDFTNHDANVLPRPGVDEICTPEPWPSALPSSVMPGSRTLTPESFLSLT